MEKTELFDVLIIGGGPAGTCAALRLLALGHRVALVEQQVFPRPQIGESLSAGVRNIFAYLDAAHLLESDTYLHTLPAQVIWENARDRKIEFRQNGGGIMVDRAKLDHDLLQLAVSKGLRLFQPAKAEQLHHGETYWQALIRENDKQTLVKAAFVLDARGRSGLRMMDKIITAPPMVALYANTSKRAMPACTLVEAQHSGWLWGSPLPGNQFRIMAFFAPDDLKKEKPAQIFSERIAASNLFADGLKDLQLSEIKSCPVLNYSHHKPWHNNYIHIGEAAFTLDPLSSTGMEKVMRFSLQTAIAINTILKSGNTELARNFYEDHMAGSVARHLAWTADYYHSAWPEGNYSFWKDRSRLKILSGNGEGRFYNQIMLKLKENSAIKKGSNPVDMTHFSGSVNQLWYKKVNLSPKITKVEAVCVENDLLELKKAVRHPLMETDIAYIDDVEILPLLKEIQEAETFGDLVYSWSKAMPFEKARDITVRLYSLGLVELS